MHLDLFKVTTALGLWFVIYHLQMTNIQVYILIVGNLGTVQTLRKEW